MLYSTFKKMTTCLFVLLLTLATSSQAQARGKFILAQPMTTDHIFHAVSNKFIHNLQQEHSKLKVKYHPGGDLGDWTSQFEQTSQGVIPMTMTYGASEYNRKLDLTWLGYVVDSWKDARKVYGVNGPMLDIYNNILKKNDVIALGVIPIGFGSLTIRKGIGKVPTNFPQDAKGIKMRVVPSSLAVARYKNWGFSAVPMPFSELYTALQLGTVDGRAFGPAVEIWQMRDVLESYVLTRDYFEHAFWLVNKRWWDRLPAKERAKIRAAADKTLQWAWREAENIDQDYLEKVRKHGIKIVELSDEERAKAKQILYQNEWPEMERVVGKKIMRLMRDIAGI